MGQTTNITKRNDDLVSQIVKIRDLYCVLKLNGCTGYAEDPMHVFGRGNRGTRWEDMAVYGGCRNCHNTVDTHPKQKEDLFRMKMGESLYEEMRMQSLRTAKYLPAELKEINVALKQRLKALASKSNI